MPPHRANYGENLLESFVGCGCQLDGTTGVLDDHSGSTLLLSVLALEKNNRISGLKYTYDMFLKVVSKAKGRELIS